jgi:hypothetical protein
VSHYPSSLDLCLAERHGCSKHRDLFKITVPGSTGVLARAPCSLAFLSLLGRYCSSRSVPSSWMGNWVALPNFSASSATSALVDMRYASNNSTVTNQPAHLS